MEIVIFFLSYSTYAIKATPICKKVIIAHWLSDLSSIYM